MIIAIRLLTIGVGRKCKRKGEIKWEQDESLNTVDFRIADAHLPATQEITSHCIMALGTLLPRR
jgi:hypothetical protein